MKDKTQRVRVNLSWCGLPIYEIEQYDLKSDKWAIVGDCSDDIFLQEREVNLHNIKLI